ncbi:MAG: VacJ family lipoprotein [Halioglobus sp.]|jgi:phospholipid-binding lipoprotein MlaA|nr:VacJ family lipoprotein [Halioglobus sp.]
MKNPLLRICFLVLLTSVGACSSGPQLQPQAADYPEPVFTPKEILPPDHANLTAVYDPWENMNKHIYNFNYEFDNAVYLPIVRGYEKIVPSFARTGLSNFYKNLVDVTSIFNSILQLAPTKTFQNTGRVLVNSTVGIFGLIDVASKMKIPRPVEDFGQTLGHWGVGQGPYLVLPFLGPSNLRDGVGLLPDFYVASVASDAVLSSDVTLGALLVYPINSRANNPFRYYQNGSAFEYEMVRWLYSTKRKLDVNE